MNHYSLKNYLKTENFLFSYVLTVTYFLAIEKYPFLVKEFDSNDHGYDYLVKIYRIDFEEFDRLKIQN